MPSCLFVGVDMCRCFCDPPHYPVSFSSSSAPFLILEAGVWSLTEQKSIGSIHDLGSFSSQAYIYIWIASNGQIWSITTASLQAGVVLAWVKMEALVGGPRSTSSRPGISVEFQAGHSQHDISFVYPDSLKIWV